MNTATHALLFVLVAELAWAQPSKDVTVGSPEATLQRLVPGIRNLKLSSRNGDVFAFQFHELVPSLRRHSRLWLSADRGPAAVYFMGGGQPVLFHLSQENVVVKSTEVLRDRVPHPWRFELSRDRTVSGVAAPYTAESDEQKTSFIGLDMSALVWDFRTEPAADARLEEHARTQSCVFHGRDDKTLAIRARTPTDTLQLGTPLGSYRVGDPDMSLWITALTVGSHFDTFCAESQVAVPARDVACIPAPKNGELTDTPDQIMLGYEIFCSLSSVFRHSDLDDKHRQLLALREADDEVLVDGRFVIDRQWLVRLCELCKQLREYATVMPSHDDEVNADRLPIDDATVRWCRIEQLLGPKLYYAVSRVIPTIVQIPSVTTEDRIRLIYAYAQLGENPCLPEMGLLKHEEEPLFRAVLHAQHRRVWTEDDVQLCQNRLNDLSGGSPAALGLTESLIMMDEVDRVSDIRMDQWYGSRIFFGLHTDRLEALRQLTLQPSGRQWLRHRLKTDDRDSAELKRLGCSALRQRATATLATKQWTFMSADECEQTIAFVDALLASLKQD